MSICVLSKGGHACPCQCHNHGGVGGQKSDPLPRGLLLAICGQKAGEIVLDRRAGSLPDKGVGRRGEQRERERERPVFSQHLSCASINFSPVDSVDAVCPCPRLHAACGPSFSILQCLCWRRMPTMSSDHLFSTHHLQEASGRCLCPYTYEHASLFAQ